MLALQRRAGNRAVAAYLRVSPARRLQRAEQTLAVAGGQSVRYDDARVGSGEVSRVWESLVGMGARLDPAAAASIYAATRREDAERPTPGIPRPPVNVKSLDIVKPVLEWRYTELAGLEQALQLARSIPALAARDPAAVVFGKVASLISFKLRMTDPGGGAKKFVERHADSAGDMEQAETVTPAAGPMSIVLAAGCKDVWPPTTTEGTLMDVVDDSINDRARALHEFDVRMLRMTWIHELGHTLYPAYKAEWERLVTEAVKRKEGSPTGYAARKPSVEEDFCESFTVLALYPKFSHVLGPTRTGFFARHRELVQRDQTSGAAPANAVSAAKI
ncbi:MAG: hypothetical protein ABI611_21400 [Solirubrobacteraceae bacterium]